MKSFGIYDLELKGFKSWKWRETRFCEPWSFNHPTKKWFHFAARPKYSLQKAMT